MPDPRDMLKQAERAREKWREGDMLGAAEAARYVGITRSSFYKHLWDKKIAARSESPMLFLLEDVEVLRVYLSTERRGKQRKPSLPPRKVFDTALYEEVKKGATAALRGLLLDKERLSEHNAEAVLKDVIIRLMIDNGVIEKQIALTLHENPVVSQRPISELLGRVLPRVKFTTVATNTDPDNQRFQDMITARMHDIMRDAREARKPRLILEDVPEGEIIAAHEEGRQQET